MDTHLLKQLHRPEIFPGEVSEVVIEQTHLSVVCLAGDSAYKLKKPIRLPFVDFSTLEKRKRICEDEVRLNRRLCPKIYRGVRPLVRLPDGGITFREDEGAGGEIIDYAVEMERLPSERMLSHLLAKDAVPVEAIREIARRMARFHHEAERSDSVNEAGDPEKLRDFALANFEESRGVTREIFDPELHRLLEGRTRLDFERLLPAMRRRSREGRIVEGHGDLHARNICLSDPIAIYDCIEFNREFRCGDTATENAFLVMDLRYSGHPELANAYLDAYSEASGDEEQRQLMPPLERYRAMVRAKVSAIAAGESELSEAEHCEAVESARRHFHRVAASVVEEDGPWIILASGLPGSGKSYRFEALAEQTGWKQFGSDRIRKELAGVDSDEALPDSAYTAEFSDRTYRELLERAADEAVRNRVALVDANFRSRERRSLAREMAVSAGSKLAIACFETPEPLILERLIARKNGAPTESDAGVSVYQTLKAEFEKPTAGECDRLIQISGEVPAGMTVPVILAEMIRY